MQDLKHRWKAIRWNGKEAGDLREDKLVFVLPRKSPQHILRIHNSIGISIAFIEYLKEITDNKIIQLQIRLKHPNNTTEYFKIGINQIEDIGIKTTDKTRLIRTPDEQLQLPLEKLRGLML